MQALDLSKMSKGCGCGYMCRPRRPVIVGICKGIHRRQLPHTAVSPGPRNIDSLFTPEPRNLSGSIEQPPQPVHKATFSVYKSSAAMRLVPLKPTWKAVGEMGTMTIERNGSLLMEFAKSSGTRQYNWEEKQTFGLSPLEMAAILESPSSKHEVFHDPGMKSSNQGQITKMLRVMPTDQGYFFSLRVKNQGQEHDVGVPVSKTEFKLFQILCEYCIPHLMGFGKMFNQSRDTRPF